MAPSDATPKSLFPGAATPVAQPASGAFATPATVEFPEVDVEDARMSAFGNRVQADQDVDLLDARVCHVREVSYGPGSPAAAFPVVPLTPPVSPSGEHGWRGIVRALLGGTAVGLLVAAVVVALFFALT